MPSAALDRALISSLLEESSSFDDTRKRTSASGGKDLLHDLSKTCQNAEPQFVTTSPRYLVHYGALE